MPILMRAEVHGQTLEGYNAVFNALAPLYSAAQGFIAHFSHPIEGGWCVMDVWASKDDFQQFFSQHVVHRLPAHVRPKISFQPIHDALVGRASTSPHSGPPLIDRP
jgi:heme-degrading monooxygenase HmoA